MTKNEYDYERMLKQMEELQKKMTEKKEILDKERDEAIIQSIHEKNISREQGILLAKLIRDEKCFETIMKMEPEAEKRIMKKQPMVKKEPISEKKESEDIV
ncbi:MAG: hypothetical protein ACI4C0_07735 [Lachnospiraceae bacterium]